jgi:outer membrane protein
MVWRSLTQDPKKERTMKKALTMALVAAAVTAASVGAQAYQAGDWIIRVGATTVDPDTDSDAIEIPTEPPTVLPNGVDVDDDTQLGIIPVWMVEDNFGIELLLATPFEHDISLEDAPVDAGSTKHLPQTLSLQWYPRGGKDGWQPYIGLGVNYTYFFDEDVDNELKGALEDILGTGLAKADLNLDDSFGLAAQAGVDIPFGEHWAFNAGIWYLDIDTTAKVKVRTEGGANATVKFDVDIDPWVYNIGIAYKF